MEKHNIRPYARLLTMLGDQLIKNETIALTELVKNAYDADADVCRVKFINFNCDSTNNSESIIEISEKWKRTEKIEEGKNLPGRERDRQIFNVKAWEKSHSIF